MKDNGYELLTIKKAADFLGVTTTTLRNWDNSKKLLAVRHPMSNYRMYRFNDLVEARKKLYK